MDTASVQIFHFSGCFIENNKAWDWADQMILFNFPLAAVFAAYPVLVLSEVRRRCRRVHVLEFESDEHTYQARSSRTTHAQAVVEGPVQNGISDATISGPAVVRRPKRPSTRPFILLTLLTLNNLIFFTPLVVVYNFFMVGATPPMHMFEVSCILLYVQGVTDPILLGLALRDIRAEFSRLFMKRRE